MGKSKKTRSIDPITGETKEYESVAEAAEAVYGNRAAIIRAAKTGGKAYGLLWEKN